MRYLIYCDEPDDKGSYYSNFYGGALLKLSDQSAIEAREIPETLYLTQEYGRDS